MGDRRASAGRAHQAAALNLGGGGGGRSTTPAGHLAVCDATQQRGAVQRGHSVGGNSLSYKGQPLTMKNRPSQGANSTACECRDLRILRSE